MSETIIGRIDEMGQRIDDLEKSIGELMTQVSPRVRLRTQACAHARLDVLRPVWRKKAVLRASRKFVLCRVCPYAVAQHKTPL